MNGKAVKRIRLAALAFCKASEYRRTVQRLKREYKLLPYHRRTDKPWQYKKSHSQMLRRSHDITWR